MYPHTRGGYRQFPGQVAFASDTEGAASFSQNHAFSNSTLDRDIRLHASGTKVFFVDQVTNSVCESTLSVAWDITSAGSITETALTHPTPDPAGVFFKPDGLKMYVFDTDDSVYQYSLSPAWDTTSLSYDSVSFSFATQLGGGFPYTGVFNSDGTKLFLAAANGSVLTATSEQRIWQYDLSSGYDLTTASYSGKFLSLGTVVETTPAGLEISADNSRLYVISRGADPHKEFYLSDPSDVSTGGVVSTLDSHALSNPPMITYQGTRFAYTAHDPAQYFTDDDFTIVAWVSPDDSTPSAFQTIFSKWEGSATKDWYFGFDTAGDLVFASSSDGTSATATSTSTATPSWSSADGLWVRVTWSGSNVLFYTSTDPLRTAQGSISWSQLGATVAHGESTMLRTNSSRLEVAGLLRGTTSLFDGEMGRVMLIGGTDATVSPTVDFNPNDHEGPISQNWLTFTFTSSTGESWWNSGFFFWPDQGIALGDSGTKAYIHNFSPDGNNNTDQFTLSTAYTFGGNTKIFRGMEVMAGVLYVIYDTTLSSVDSSGALTSIGTIDGSEMCVLETDGTQLVITTGSTGAKIYVYTVAGGLVTVTDADITDTAKSSAYLDLRFWFDQPNGQFNSSAVDDATDFNALDFATAESFADDLIRVYAHNQLLYLFGEQSTEIWRTGSGRPPANRQQVIERGIAGVYAVDSIDDTIFFLDQYGRPNMMSGLQYQPIYTPAIAEEWSTYNNISDCVVSAYEYRQTNFVDFVFPSVAWTYHVASAEWSQRKDSDGNRYPVLAHADAYSKTLVGLNSKIYELSETTYQDDSSNITRTLFTETVGPELVGADTRRVAVNGIWLTIEATASGTVSVSFAEDGGTFGTAKTLTVTAGVKNYPLPTPWGVCSEGVFKITTTANAGIDIVDATVDVSPLNV